MTLVTATVKNKTTVTASTNSVTIGGAAASVTIGVFSDAGHTTPITSAYFGATVYLTATPSSGFVPTSYRFYFEDFTGGLTLIYEGANDNSSWVVYGVSGLGRLFSEATDDDENWVGVDADLTTVGLLMLDIYTGAIIAPSLIKLRSLYSGGLERLRRSSNSNEADFTPTNANTPPIIALDSIASGGVPSSVDGDTLAQFMTTDDGFASVVYDQSTFGNDLAQATANNQPSSVYSGIVDTIGGNPILDFDGSNDALLAWNNEAAPVSFQGIGNAISIVFWVSTEGLSFSGMFWRPDLTIVECRQNNSSDAKIPFSVGMANNKVSVGVADNYTFSYDRFESTFTYSTGTLYAFAVTIDNNTIKMYVNGSLDSTHTIVNSTGDRSIGTTNSSLSYGVRTRDGGQADENYYNGKMIHLPIIFPSVLTAAQVLAIYNDFQSSCYT